MILTTELVILLQHSNTEVKKKREIHMKYITGQFKKYNVSLVYNAKREKCFRLKNSEMLEPFF